MVYPIYVCSTTPEDCVFNMYAIYKQIHPPTAIEHCVHCNFLSPTSKNLVIAGVNQLHVYRLTADAEVLLNAAIISFICLPSTVDVICWCQLFFLNVLCLIFSCLHFVVTASLIADQYKGVMWFKL